MDTKELRRLLSEATPGPWQRAGCAVCPEGMLPGSRDFIAPNIATWADAAFIAAARNALPELLDALEQAQAMLPQEPPKRMGLGADLDGMDRDALVTEVLRLRALYNYWQKVARESDARKAELDAHRAREAVHAEALRYMTSECQQGNWYDARDRGLATLESASPAALALLDVLRAAEEWHDAFQSFQDAVARGKLGNITEAVKAYRAAIGSK